ncbi:MAG: AraC family transcriptional regulator [Lachnospiraceae bacterium]|nr:AraC family transcriptional regulator [Lachnospiraceae bacterium]
MYRESFNPSQMMTERYFELHHNYNEAPLSVEFHQHPFYEIFFFLSGNVTYIIEGRSYKLRPGDILLTGNQDIHRPDIRPGKPYERIVIWLMDDFFNHLKDFYGDDLTSCFSDAARNNYRLIRPDGTKILYLKQLCQQISLTARSLEIGSAALASAYLTEFLVHVSRAYYDAPASIKRDVIENKKVNQAVQYINENLTEDLSLDRLAAQFYISKYYLSRQFRQFTGLSVYQYIMKKRLIIARNLLRGGSSAMDACLQCGFNDYSNFLKAFKREFGTTPGQYSRR